ncbi:MAG: lysine--tRNA ligase [Alphaproteobacteria bacterium]|jgi:lysyl-tRNA synthetase class 1|nr:lysine--tRNA ligase [Alphaproteobacteria bacterium]
MDAVTPDVAAQCKAWPFREAKALLARLGGPERAAARGQPVVFETGYGPSGLPHIGTFQEVARTAMVQRAFQALAPGVPTRLICFSDDMDGLRKVPGNVPNPDMLAQHLGRPLSAIPDPFGTHESYAAHNNASLRAFLDSFGFAYNFVSSTACYKGGRFDAVLLKMLTAYDAVRAVVLPLLGPERAATYAPFLPISPATGRVLQVPVEPRPTDGTIVFTDEDGVRREVPVTGGHVKAQWRADWGMRWVALGVDYEMAGEDLQSSARVAGEIARLLGGGRPAGFHYKLFLDADGKKISKSKGNGLTMEEWLRYAPHESLAYYVFGRPESGKRLHFDVIPRAVDEYLDAAARLAAQDPADRLNNPVWYMGGGEEAPVSFGLLLNLVAVVGAGDAETLWAYVRRYAPGAARTPLMDRLLSCAVAYHQDFIEPHKRYRSPDARERAAMTALAGALEAMDAGTPEADIQTAVFTAGKQNGYDKAELRHWFGALYQVLLGQESGPRFGAFAALYSTQATAALIRRALG